MDFTRNILAKHFGKDFSGIQYVKKWLLNIPP